ncbi:tRNA pseudouridine(38-40) synthase TruA [Rickettsiales endosymbiont of Peranema trichophorum]|uniref:tRNA pseudouridine(38-40) synthase TruA n=1 Tax=Rickettsiales endosymbiont of Peranema trichophorum TaxID=2486577 RepID=UPI001022B933|nr:tRNA pseudouridine(38-40) synthase TruA [Rickettsiales endosymbiont of Peranema trichophorum]RZI46006.1 tRNA pseudouridine(38-40) synthase TruA [Rickettsiales endosymbiont of Peranema trichophorum]
MARYKLTIEHDGQPFVGWQKQQNGLSVQCVLEDAIEKFAHEKVVLHGAGRTDAGVHAIGQVAHFDLVKSYDVHTIKNALNHYVRHYKIAILSVVEVDQKFHARFSATERAYLYKILNRKTPSPLLENKAWYVPQPLDIGKMECAASYFIGRHDFASFRAAKCQANHAIRMVKAVDIQTTDAVWDSLLQHILVIKVVAPSFLHNQVRIMVGTLVKVGLGDFEPSYVQNLLLMRDRTKAGITAPAHGLYLLSVKYD